MGRSFGEPITPFTIASGNSESNVLDSFHDYGDAAGLAIASPEGLVEGVQLQASLDESGDTWFFVEDTDGSDITLPAAGNTRAYFSLPIFARLKLLADAPAAADRVFKVHKLFTT